MIFDPRDPESVAAWLAPRFAGAYAAAWRILHDPAAAEDAAQEALVAAVRSAPALAAARDPERYLARMAVNAALAHLRSERSRRARERRAAMATGDADGGGRTDPAYEAAEAREAVGTALATLPEDLRVALVLRHAESLTFAEIGEAVGCSAPAAHDRVRRGEERVRARLGRAWPGEQALGATLAAISPATPEGAAGRALAAVRAALAAPAPSSAGAPRLPGAAVLGTVAAALATAVVAALLTLGGGAPPPGAPGAAAGGGGGAAGGAVADASPGTGPGGAGGSGSGSGSGTGEPAAPSSGSTGETAHGAPPPPLPPSGGFLGGPPSATASLERAPSAASETASTLDGVLVDLERRPIAGAPLEARSLALFGKGGDGVRATTTTAEDGTFRLALPARSPSGEAFALLVGNTRRADVLALPGRRATPRPPDPEDTEALPEARLLAGGVVEVVAPRPLAQGRWVVRGVVRDEDGAPLARAEVMLWSAEGPTLTSPDFQGRAFFPTDEQGRFEIEGRTLGKVALTVAGDGRRPDHEERFTVADGDVVEREVRLSRGLVISGRVVSLETGAPVSQARVHAHASGASEDRSWCYAWTDAEGHFSLVGLAAGRHDLDGPGFYRAGVEAGTADVVLRVKTDARDDRDEGDHGAEIHGPVVDASGAPRPIVPGMVHEHRLAPGEDPLADAIPHLYFPAPCQVGFSGPPPKRPAPEARFDALGLAPGRYVVLGGGDVYYEGTGFEAGPKGWSEAIDLAEGEIRRGVRFVVPRTGTLEGEARDARTDAPLGDAAIFVFGTGPSSDAGLRNVLADVAKAGALLAKSAVVQSWGRAASDAAGRFRIEGVPPGVPLRVVVAAGGRKPVVLGPVTLVEGAESPRLTAALEAR